MRRPLLLVAAAVLVGCAGGASGSATETGAASPEPAPTRTVDAPEATTVIESAEPSVATSDPGGEPIVIRTRMVIAAEERTEPIAIGEVIEGSTLGDSPFCAGGTIQDSHARLDPAVKSLGLIDRMISCSDGTARIVFTPEVVPQGQTQTGSWTIVSGTGAFEGLRGDGAMEVVYDPDDDSLGLETLTGTVTR